MQLDKEKGSGIQPRCAGYEYRKEWFVPITKMIFRFLYLGSIVLINIVSSRINQENKSLPVLHWSVWIFVTIYLIFCLIFRMIYEKEDVILFCQNDPGLNFHRALKYLVLLIYLQFPADWVHLMTGNLLLLKQIFVFINIFIRKQHLPS